ncbi:MAG: hypothetical protein IPP40_10310 [bacterium]|nr:hypothetical protein [bacterium]
MPPEPGPHGLALNCRTLWSEAGRDYYIVVDMDGDVASLARSNCGSPLADPAPALLSCNAFER